MLKVLVIILLTLAEGWFIWAIPNSVKKLRKNQRRAPKYEDQTSIQKLSGPWGAGNFAWLIPIQFTFLAVVLGGFLILLIVDMF